MTENSQNPQKSGEDRLLSLTEFCSALSISTATAKNWLRLGKITPQYEKGKKLYFTQKYTGQLIQDIESGKNPALKSRRNKKYISGNSLYHSYVESDSPNIEIVQSLLENAMTESFSRNETAPADSALPPVSPPNENTLRFLLADCAIQLFSQRLEDSPCTQTEMPASMLAKYMAGHMHLGIYAPLVDDLIGDTSAAGQFTAAHANLFSYKYNYIQGEDTLGLLYLSARNIADRKAAGSYYTPTDIVRRTVAKLCGQDKDLSRKKILDPCCGTGNFLLQLPADFQIENIYGNDIDEISVLLTRINLALARLPEQINILYQNVTHLNFLCDDTQSGFDYILGNPPWGYAFSEPEKIRLRQNYRCIGRQNVESYDLFLEQALRCLKKGGMLSYVLPEAILNVAAHTPIRKIILQTSSISYLEYLGNTFDQVQCPCIILQLCHTGKPLSCIGMEISDSGRSFTLSQNHAVSAEYFCFQATDAELAVLDKLMTHPGCITLKNHAEFALGIVTGNNRLFLSKTENEKNEPLYKGSDIRKFRTKPPKNFISYLPGNFQQAAPEKYYRAPEKLLYRFVCRQLVFAYDDKQSLSLNSCNILIPDVPGLSMKYIMAVLNSRTAQFIFQKRFHSVKVLRSHIEKIPIPMADSSEQNALEEITDRIANADSAETIFKYYNELDKKIARLYELSREEYEIILDALDGINLFLC